jgi:predicted RNase H-like HicB family nuclease
MRRAVLALHGAIFSRVYSLTMRQTRSQRTKRLRYTAIITREGEWYIARCIELSVTTQGRTLDEARTNLQEAVELYLESFETEEPAESTTEALHAVSLTRCSNWGDSALGVALTPSPSPARGRGEHGVRKRSFRLSLKLRFSTPKIEGDPCALPPYRRRNDELGLGSDHATHLYRYHAVVESGLLRDYPQFVGRGRGMVLEAAAAVASRAA